MKYCNNCGKPLADGVAFCGFCGSKCEISSSRKSSAKTNQPSPRKVGPKIIAAVIFIMIICIAAVVFITSRQRPSKVKNAEDAIAQLKELEDALGYENALSELTEKHTTTIDGDNYYRLQQNYQGLPVHGRTVVYVTDENGETIAMTSNVLDVDENINANPTVTAQTIQLSVKQYAKDTMDFDADNCSVDIMPEQELVWYVSPSGNSALAYNLVAYIAGLPYEIVVDAHDGSVFKANCQIQTESVPVNVTASGLEYEVNIWREDDGKYTTYDAERNIRWQSANGETLEVSLIFKDKSGVKYRYDVEENTMYDEWGNKVNMPTGSPESMSYIFTTKEKKVGVTQPRFVSFEYLSEDAACMMLYVTMANDYYTKMLSRDGWGDDYRKTLEVVYDCTGSTSYHRTLMDNASVLCILSGESLNVVTHELTHAMEQSESNMDCGGETGAIKEALSDIFAEIVEYDYNGECDWLYDSGVRNLIDPLLSTEDNRKHPLEYLGKYWVDTTDKYDDGGVHINSTVISHAAYLMSKDGGGILTMDELAKLWYRAMLMMPSDCNFAQCRTLVELAGDAMNLSDEQIQCIEQAFDKVGILDDELVDYKLNLDAALCVYGADAELYDNYTVQIDGVQLFLGNIDELKNQELRFPLDLEYLYTMRSKDYSAVINVSAAEEKALNLPIGIYTVKICDNADASRNYVFKISTVTSGGKDKLDLYTNFCEKKQLKQVNTYYQGELIQTDTFSYNENQQLIGAHIEYLDYLDTAIDCTYTYDSAGKLISADHDDFWLYFGNEEYDYNQLEQLVRYKYYWGGSKLPYYQCEYEYNSEGECIYETEYYLDESPEKLEKTSVFTLTYKHDNLGRIVEKSKRYTWIGTDFHLITSCGEHWATEYDYVTKYTYDSDDRVITEEQLYVVDDLVAEDYTKKYNYQALPFVAVTVVDNYETYTTLEITDSAGKAIWSSTIYDSEMIFGNDGHVTKTTVNQNGYWYEFLYDEDVMNKKEELNKEEKFEQIGKGLQYPISEEDAYIIFNNYFSEFDDQDISVEVSRTGEGADEMLFFEIKMEFLLDEPPMTWGFFNVFVNTGICKGGAQGHEDLWPVFRAEDYYY